MSKDYRSAFIQEVETALITRYDPDEVAQISHIVIKVLSEYEITERCTDLVVQDDVNERLLKKFKACLLIDGKSKNTIKIYSSVINNIYDVIRKPFPEMSTYDIRYYLAVKMDSGASNRTLENYRAYLSSFFQWMLNDEVITKNPAAAIKPIKYKDEIRKPFSSVEMDALKDACKNVKERAIVEFLASTGVRVHELVSMERDDVNFSTLSVRVANGKGNKERITYTTPVSLKYLLQYLGTRKDDNTHLFMSRKGVYTTDGLRNLLKSIGSRAGIDDVHPHRFRRTFATNLSQRGMEIQEIQKLLGHSDIKTTLVYVNTDDSKIQSSYKRYTA